MMELLALLGWQKVRAAWWEKLYCKLGITSHEINLIILKNDYMMFRTVSLKTMKSISASAVCFFIVNIVDVDRRHGGREMGYEHAIKLHSHAR